MDAGATIESNPELWGIGITMSYAIINVYIIIMKVFLLILNKIISYFHKIKRT